MDHGVELKVLYLPGFESGPGGRKVKLLRAAFHDVSVAIMPTARLSPTGFCNPYFNAALMLVLPAVLVALYAVVARYWLHPAGIVLAAAAIFGGGLVLRLLVAYGVSHMLEMSVKASAAELVRCRPDVVVGSSWGGAVGVELIVRGLWKGPSLLLCPAAAKVARLALLPSPAPEFQDALLEAGKEREVSENSKQAGTLPGHPACMIVHGSDDRTVPLRDSLELVGPIGPRLWLHEVADDHRLSVVCSAPSRGPTTGGALASTAGAESTLVSWVRLVVATDRSPG